MSRDVSAQAFLSIFCAHKRGRPGTEVTIAYLYRVHMQHTSEPRPSLDPPGATGQREQEDN